MLGDDKHKQVITQKQADSTGQVEKVKVAEVNWSDLALGLSDKDQTLYAKYRIDAVELLDKDGIGYRIASEADQTLSTLLTGLGNVTFSSDAGSNTDITVDIAVKNYYRGATYVNSDAGKGRITVKAGRDNAFGNTKLLSIGQNGTVEIVKDKTQMVGGLEVFDGGYLELNGTLSLIDDLAGEGGSNNHITGANALRDSGTLSLINS